MRGCRVPIFRRDLAGPKAASPGGPCSATLGLGAWVRRTRVPDLARSPRCREVRADEHPVVRVCTDSKAPTSVLSWFSRTSSHVDGARELLALPEFAWDAPDTSITRSADDETMRVPAGCPKHPVHRSCLRRTPGRDSTLERRSPEVKAEAAFRSNLPLVHLLASARPVPSGLRFPGTNLRSAEQLRCHATTTPCRTG